MSGWRHNLARGVATSRATLLLAVAALLASNAPGGLDVLVLERAVDRSGDVWRLLTGHFVHSDQEHLAWNLSGLIILGIAFEPLLRWRLPGVLLASALAIDLWFFLGNDTLARYCGLSGALHGLLVLGLLEWNRRSAELLPLLILVGAGAKLCFEAMAGINVFTSPAWQSVPVAHLIGMLTGFAWHVAGQAMNNKRIVYNSVGSSTLHYDQSGKNHW